MRKMDCYVGSCCTKSLGRIPRMLCLTRKKQNALDSGCCPSSIVTVGFQHGEKRLLRNLHSAKLFHPLLSFLLFFEQLSLARNVTAVTPGTWLLHSCGRRTWFLEQSPCTNDGLNGNFELVLVDFLRQAFTCARPRRSDVER